jgi:hypothetical protein
MAGVRKEIPMTTPQYELLRASITDADCTRAFDYLYPAHVGYPNRAGIEDIAFELYRSRSENAIRKARDVVELLRTDYGIAVCSTSGKAGRWLASTEAEKRECLADFYNRRASIDAVIKALEKATVPPVKILPPKPVEAVQVSLF